jgi:hypothetical protein
MSDTSEEEQALDADEWYLRQKGRVASPTALAAFVAIKRIDGIRLLRAEWAQAFEDFMNSAPQ